MARKLVLVVYGTRPEAIKLAPLIIKLKQLDDLKVISICTGQHKKLLEGISEIWGFKPDILIDMEFSVTLNATATKIGDSLMKTFLELRPDLIVVQGDTTTALMAALHAHYLQIPIAHVEAGLRSGDLWNPWPEEGNRRMIDAISSLLFAPTKTALLNLESEGLAGKATLTGNTVVDALNFVSEKLEKNENLSSELQSVIDFDLNDPFILFTQHRRESFGSGQTQIFKAIRKLGQKGFKVIFPVHLNPNVKALAFEILHGQTNIYLVPPLPYLQFVALIRKSSLIISDSGGLQEEAPTFYKRILITRHTTERPEVIESGFGTLVGYDSKAIFNLAIQILTSTEASERSINPFGDGNASNRIAIKISEYLLESS